MQMLHCFTKTLVSPFTPDNLYIGFAKKKAKGLIDKGLQGFITKQVQDY
jgi:hypothetical protein